MKNLAVTFIFSLSLILGNYSYAQKGIIYLTNPSFEETFLKYSVPRGWKDCGEELFPKETPPDVHPIVSQLFGVNQKPADQSTYLGLVVRENGSWEAVSQKLVKPMKANQCYAFRIRFNFKNKFTKRTKIDFRVILAAMNKFPNQKLVVLLDGEGLFNNLCHLYRIDIT